MNLIGHSMRFSRQRMIRRQVKMRIRAHDAAPPSPRSRRPVRDAEAREASPTPPHARAWLVVAGALVATNLQIRRRERDDRAGRKLVR